MDIYLLSRLFREFNKSNKYQYSNSPKYSIIITGDLHTENYYRLLTKFLYFEEKEYIKKGITSLKSLTGYAPKGWYYGRPSPHSRSLIPQVYEEMGEELVWASDTYADDVPYWIDLPKEREKKVSPAPRPHSICHRDTEAQRKSIRILSLRVSVSSVAIPFAFAFPPSLRFNLTPRSP